MPRPELNGAGDERAPAPPAKLMIAASGSVALLALPGYLYAFRAVGVQRIVVVLSPTAQRFLPAKTLKLVCDGVYGEDDPGRGHVALGRWPDHILALPATAHLLGCLANGLAPSLLTATLVATEAPITLVPAMNPSMWHKAAVQRNVATLRGDGHVVLEPEPGFTYEVASGEIVAGAVTPGPEALLAAMSEPRGRAEPVAR